MQVRYLYEAEGNKKANNAKAVSFITMVVVIIMIIIINRKWQAKLLSSLTSYNQSVNVVVFQNYVYRDFSSYSVLFALFSPAYLRCYRNRPFQLVCFVFPFQTTWCPHGNLPFVFCISYANICTCIRRHLKETIPSSSIMRSEMGKQNIQAEKVYWSSIVRCYILWADNRDEINQSKSHKRGAISEVEEWIIAFGLQCTAHEFFIRVVILFMSLEFVSFFRDTCFLWRSGKLLSLLYHVSMLTNFAVS